ncbi:MAG: hypothetical protein FWB93_06395 [Oscillospiraceae bacterium]|nr:hypothetical protein [Oscillospiraceae bacterium]
MIDRHASLDGTPNKVVPKRTYRPNSSSRNVIARRDFRRSNPLDERFVQRNPPATKWIASSLRSSQ